MKKKILVINDEDPIREMVVFFLQAKGYEVFEANGGQIGIEQAIQQKPDLILLDIVMPEMDGFETCQKLKASSATKDIPILFFSSLTNPKDKIKGLELGAVDFINNVVDQGELLARVQTHLQIQSLTNSLIESNEQLTRKQKFLDDDLHAAALIQRSFLLAADAKIPHLQLAAAWLPANLIGGDIYNVVQYGKDKVIFYMIDVSGHDVPSALVTVSVSQYLHQKNINALLSPKQLMIDLDTEYPLERFNRYFTIFYAILDIPTGNLIYSSAGHPPAILLPKDKELQSLNTGGTIIGLNQTLPFDEGETSLNHQDKILIYTDGVIEARNINDELYGMERLHVLLEQIKHRPVEEIVNSIQSSLNDFTHGTISEDDISILCFEYRS